MNQFHRGHNWCGNAHDDDGCQNKFKCLKNTAARRLDKLDETK